MSHLMQADEIFLSRGVQLLIHVHDSLAAIKRTLKPTAHFAHSRPKSGREQANCSLIEGKAGRFGKASSSDYVSDRGGEATISRGAPEQGVDMGCDTCGGVQIFKHGHAEHEEPLDMQSLRLPLPP